MITLNRTGFFLSERMTGPERFSDNQNDCGYHCANNKDTL